MSRDDSLHPAAPDSLARVPASILARVLVVEDDHVIAQHLKQLLERLGYDVLGPVASGEEALEKVDERCPDLVLMDIYLAGELDGIETASRIRARCDLPVIYLTAYSRDELLEQAGHTAPYGYLTKPVRDADLRVAIEMALHRHALEVGLRESEEKYRALTENSPNGIFISDADRFIYVNQRLCEMTGFSRDELLNMPDPPGTLFAPQERERTLAYALSRLSGDSSPTGYQVRGIRKDGQEIWLNLFVTAIDLSGARVLQGTVEDITERVRTEEVREQAEEALRESERNFRALTESANDGIVVVMDEGYLVYANERAAEIVGYGVAELVGMDIQDLIHPDEYRELVERLRKRLAGERVPTRYEMTITGKDGTPVPVEVTSAPTAWRGRPAVIVIVRDITERKRAEGELKERLQFERLIAELSSRFVGIGADQIDTEIERAFERIGTHFHTDRIGLLELSKDKKRYHISHSWAAEGIDPARAALSTDSFPNIRDKLLFQGEPFTFSSVEEIPEEAVAERHYYDQQGIKSGLVIPLTIAGDVIGGLSLSAMRVGRDWPAEIVQRLFLFGGIITNALVRKAMIEDLRDSEGRLSSFMDSASDSFYLLDADLNFVEINQRGLNIIGRSREEVVGRNIADIVPDVKESGRYEKHLEVIRTGRPFVVEDFVPHPVFGDLHIVLKSFKVGDGLGVIASDITERVRSEEERAQAEEALREREEMIRALVETSKDWIWSIDLQGIHTYCNPATEAILGYRPEELVGKQSFDLVHEEDRVRIEGSLRGWIQEKRGWNNQLIRWRHKDGSYRCLESNAVPILNAENELIGFRGVDRDITDRKRAEDSLAWELAVNMALAKVSHTLIDPAASLHDIAATTLDSARLLTESTHGYVSSIDPETGDNVGYAFTDMMKSQHRAVADDRQTIFPLGADGRYPGLWGHALNTRQPFYTNSPADHAASQGTPEGHVPLGNFLSVPAVVGEELVGQIALANSERGYTERDLEAIGRLAELYALAVRHKRVEGERGRLLDQVREQVRQMQQIVDTVPDGMLLLDSDKRIILANPTARESLIALTGARTGDILTHLGNRPLAEFLTSPPRGQRHEVKVDGQTYEAVARPLETGPETRGWVLVVNDVTEERQVQRRIQQQERLAALGQLAAGIAHDFNNIMAVISLYAGMLLQTPELQPKVDERLRTIRQQARRASDLIQQVLDFSRRAVLERGPLDLNMFLKEQIKLLRRTLPEHIKIDLSYGKDEYVVNADPTRIQQAIMNLATNARDAMPEGGQLRIRLERVRITDRRSAPLPDLDLGDWVCVRVTDNGTGIPPDVLPHIFDPFFTTKEAGLGTGLGLSQVYGIVRQHGGQVDVKTRVSEGTTFFLYLPALPIQGPEATDSDVIPLVRGEGQAVLVVEDEEITRQAIVGSLDMLGYRVLEAADGQEALALFEQHTGAIDLVLSDMIMPEMGGRALFHALKQRDTTVRVLLLTGHPLEGEELEDLSAQGLKGWLLKPPSLEQLAQAVARALED